MKAASFSVFPGLIAGLFLFSFICIIRPAPSQGLEFSEGVVWGVVLKRDVYCHGTLTYPLEGATVSTRWEEAVLYGFPEDWGVSTTTDADGSFELSHWPSDITVTLTVEKEGYESTVIPGVYVPGGPFADFLQIGLMPHDPWSGSACILEPPGNSPETAPEIILDFGCELSGSLGGDTDEHWYKIGTTPQAFGGIFTFVYGGGSKIEVYRESDPETPLVSFVDEFWDLGSEIVLRFDGEFYYIRFTRNPESDAGSYLMSTSDIVTCDIARPGSAEGAILNAETFEIVMDVTLTVLDGSASQYYACYGLFEIEYEASEFLVMASAEGYFTKLEVVNALEGDWYWMNNLPGEYAAKIYLIPHSKMADEIGQIDCPGCMTDADKDGDVDGRDLYLLTNP